MNPFDFAEAYPAPYVRRALTFEIRERTNAQGEVLRADTTTSLSPVIAVVFAQSGLRMGAKRSTRSSSRSRSSTRRWR